MAEAGYHRTLCGIRRGLLVLQPLDWLAISFQARASGCSLTTHSRHLPSSDNHGLSLPRPGAQASFQPLRIPTLLSPRRCVTSCVPICKQAYPRKISRIRYRMRLCGRGSGDIVNILRTSLRIFLRLFGKNYANALEGTSDEDIGT